MFRKQGQMHKDSGIFSAKQPFSTTSFDMASNLINLETEVHSSRQPMDDSYIELLHAKMKSIINQNCPFPIFPSRKKMTSRELESNRYKCWITRVDITKGHPIKVRVGMYTELDQLCETSANDAATEFNRRASRDGLSFAGSNMNLKGCISAVWSRELGVMTKDGIKCLAHTLFPVRLVVDTIKKRPSTQNILVLEKHLVDLPNILPTKDINCPFTTQKLAISMHMTTVPPGQTAGEIRIDSSDPATLVDFSSSSSSCETDSSQASRKKRKNSHGSSISVSRQQRLVDIEQELTTLQYERLQLIEELRLEALAASNWRPSMAAAAPVSVANNCSFESRLERCFEL